MSQCQDAIWWANGYLTFTRFPPLPVDGNALTLPGVHPGRRLRIRGHAEALTTRSSPAKPRHPPLPPQPGQHRWNMGAFGRDSALAASWALAPSPRQHLPHRLAHRFGLPWRIRPLWRIRATGMARMLHESPILHANGAAVTGGRHEEPAGQVTAQTGPHRDQDPGLTAKESTHGTSLPPGRQRWTVAAVAARAPAGPQGHAGRLGPGRHLSPQTRLGGLRRVCFTLTARSHQLRVNVRCFVVGVLVVMRVEEPPSVRNN
jgi:hypothetical protein